MAQRTKSRPVPSPQVTHDATSVDAPKKLKYLGRTYTVSEMFQPPGSITQIDKGDKLVECNDGWYAIFKGGERLYYRVGPKLFEIISKV